MIGEQNNTCSIDLYDAGGNKIDHVLLEFTTKDTEQIRQDDTAVDQGNSEFGKRISKDKCKECDHVFSFICFFMNGCIAQIIYGVLIITVLFALIWKRVPCRIVSACAAKIKKRKE
jgi:hypothetical protein